MRGAAAVRAFALSTLALAASCDAPSDPAAGRAANGAADRVADRAAASDAATPNAAEESVPATLFESGPGAIDPELARRDDVRVRVVETRDDGRLMLERAGGVMGTSMRLVAIGSDRALLDAALVAAEAELRRVEDAMTSWRPSPLTAMNARAGEGAVEIPVELARMVERALMVAELTGGAFDPTWPGIGSLWDLKAEPPMIPDDAAIERAVALVDFRRVEVVIDEGADTATVALPEGFAIGLGGIAKGYGVDRAMQVLLDHGVEHGLVDAGGDLKALGRHFDEPWDIAIRHPRRAGDVMAVVPVSNACVVTSGDYERFAEVDGVRYHHILDPRTGRPSTGAMSATVVGPDAAVCDALATALCVMGPEQGLPLIERSGAYQAICVDMDGEVATTEGLVGARR